MDKMSTKLKRLAVSLKELEECVRNDIDELNALRIKEKVFPYVLDKFGIYHDIPESEAQAALEMEIKYILFTGLSYTDIASKYGMPCIRLREGNCSDTTKNK